MRFVKNIRYCCQTVPKNLLVTFLLYFSLYLVNAVSWFKREAVSFIIVPKLFQKHSADYGDTFGHLTGSIIWMPRRQRKNIIKIWSISKINVHLVGKNSKTQFWIFSLHLENAVFLARKRIRFIQYYSKTFPKTFF